MIRKYFDFIIESNDRKNIGEYVEKEYGDDEYALSIISQYTKDIDPTIRLSNAFNMIPEDTQDLILDLIKRHREGESPEPAEVTTYTDVNLSESSEQSGKNIFRCFLKVMTALGFKDIATDWASAPDDYLIFFRTTPMDTMVVKTTMSRYSYFDRFINSVDYTHNECRLYYGIKCDGTFGYGISTDDQTIQMGLFLITKGIFNWLVTLDSPSAKNLKREIIPLDSAKISLMGKIKSEMSKFDFGIPNSSKMKPEIVDGIITFGYKGIGGWKDGVLNPEDLDSMKKSIKNFLSRYRWSEKIQVSVSVGNDFWILIRVRIK
jgi:hypothetical protein